MVEWGRAVRIITPVIVTVGAVDGEGAGNRSERKEEGSLPFVHSLEEAVMVDISKTVVPAFTFFLLYIFFAQSLRVWPTTMWGGGGR